MSRHSAVLFAFSATLACAVAGCVVIYRGVEVEPLSPDVVRTEVFSPLKAHLHDGRVVVFPNGAYFGDDDIQGSGIAYSLNLAERQPITSVARADVAAVEVYDTRYNTGRSVAVSALLTTGALVGIPALAVAIFGSCPTVYSDDGVEPALEAELFSNSIAPMLEKRDVNRLAARPDGRGVVSLEIRNEALETHYINHLELLEIAHAADAVVAPDERGRVLVMSNLEAPARARDRAGRDVVGELADRDDRSFASDEVLLAAADADDHRDFIDLTFAPPGAPEVALMFRLRNSLFSSVLFYEYMLAAQGARALDWLGRDLSTVSAAVELGDFYRAHMGLRILIEEDGVLREAGRIPEVGPIAWSDVAVRVAARPFDSLRVRLSFITDAWRIDEVRLASAVEEHPARPVPITRLVDRDGRTDASRARALSAPDTSYVVTFPGEVFAAEFDVGADVHGGERTFLLAAQGFYIEWMRDDWLAADAPPGLDLSSKMLASALARWRETRVAFEKRFFDTRIPVR